MSDEYSVIALYGISRAEGIMSKFHDEVLLLLHNLECLPDYMSVHGPGHSGKTVSFKSAESKLQRTGFDSVESISIFSALPDAEIPVNDYKLSAYFSKSKADLFISAQSSIAPLDQGYMFDIASKLIEASHPAYGIGYNRDHALGPAMYAIGLAQGLGMSGKSYLEGLNISFWNDGQNARIWERGLVRDIYKWNFLTQPQLKQPINGTSLQSWIQSYFRRGSLTTMSGGVLLWEIDNADIPVVKRALWEANLIFDWTRHIEGTQAHPSAIAAYAWAASR